MERQNEIILQNTKLEYVLQYLYDKLKGLNGVVKSQTLEDGTIFNYCIQNVQPAYQNKIIVKYSSTVTPKGNVDKAYGYWGDLQAMTFEGLQLQMDTVRIKGECQHPVILTIFDRYWADMLRDFGANEPAKDDEATRIKREALIKMAGIYSDATDALNGKPEKKPKQKGRYRLTAEEIKFRKKKVKEAEKMKKDNPQKQWKEIDKIFADEIGSISDRTFRDWRHTHYS